MEVTRKGQQQPSVWPDDFYNMARVTVVDTLTGKTYTKYSDERKNFTLKPWETLIIPRYPWLANKGIETYTVTESTEDQHRVFEWKDGIWLEVSQKEPEQDQGATGTLEENPAAKIINLISSLFLKMDLRLKNGWQSVQRRFRWELNWYGDGTV